MTSTSSFIRPGYTTGNSDWIDARFERAVDIIQSLPRSGPIQTSYDDKLVLYSVYKQATEGDVKSSRPGMLDVLGRAKWDAWNKRKGMVEDDAKRVYVESLIKILRGFSDRPQAASHIRELENFSLDPRQGIPTGSTAQSDSASSTSDDRPPPSRQAPSSRRAPRPPPSQSRRPPTSHHSASVAPSLPGYGPPRTAADPIYEAGSGSSDYTSEEEHRPGPSQHREPQLPFPPQPPARLLSPALPSPNPFPSFAPSSAYPPPMSVRSGVSQAPPMQGVQMAGMRPMAQSLNLQQQHLQHLQLLQQQQQGQQQRPPALDAALERIQNSLTTLHARMNELEQPQPGLVKTAFLHFLVLLNLRQARPERRIQTRALILRVLVGMLRGARRVVGDLVVLLLVVRLVGGDWRRLMRVLRVGRRRGQ